MYPKDVPLSRAASRRVAQGLLLRAHRLVPGRGCSCWAPSSPPASASSGWCARARPAPSSLTARRHGRRVRGVGVPRRRRRLRLVRRRRTSIAYNWVLQTIVVLLGGAAAWFWAAGNPERAELTVWNTHQVWRLYRANWQGMLGLGILVFFVAMALLAPFLMPTTRCSTRTRRSRTPAVSLRRVPPADAGLLQLVRHRPGRPVGARAVHLERAHLAHRRSARRHHVDRARRRHRHRRRLLRRLAGRGLDAPHRRLPGHPVAAAGDGPGGRLGPELLHDHHHHRHHELAGHGARGALGRAARARAAVHRARPAPSARATGTSCASTCCPT